VRAAARDAGAEGGRPIVVVDLDGTVADVRHRLHHIQGPRRKNWKKFFEAMDRDTPIAGVIERVRELAGQADIIIVTGRPDTYEARSAAWLERHGVPFTRMLMRPAGDHRPDYVTKEDLLRTLPVERITLAIDDRAPVCEMYRRYGIEVLEIGSDSENQNVNEAYRQHPR
jgi:hypothetical protein